MIDQFVVRELHYVFGVDALETSRPINLPVTTPAEISRMFDAISYDKGIINSPSKLEFKLILFCM